MKIKRRRIISIILFLLLLFSCVPSGSAAGSEAPYISGNGESLLNQTFGENAMFSNNETTASALEPDTTLLSDPEEIAKAEAAYREKREREQADAFLAETKIADYVNVEEFYKTRPLFRIKEQETLNSYIFQNADRTKTIYLMAENVKYVDESGNILEKDIRLTASDSGYAVNDSDIKLLLPQRLSSGITLNTAIGSVILVPQFLADNDAKFDDKTNSVKYENVFGEGTFLRYTPTLSGLKEDIVLEYRPESNEFNFMLDAPEMTLETEDSLYYLVAADNKDQRFRFDQIFIYDANGRFTVGNMKITGKERGEFLLTITAPDEFLDDQETAYPVTVDPSFGIVTTLNSNGIIDAAVYANQPNMNAGTWQYNNIGYTDSTYGLARTVIKLSALLNNTTYQNLTASQINSVTFSAMEATGNSSKAVKIYAITGTPTWTESSVTWNNYGSFDSTVNYGGTLTSNQYTSFNITDLVKAWKNGSYNGNGSFIFIMGGTENSQHRALCSTEYSGVTCRPYIMVTYSPALTLNTDTVEINEGDTFQLNVSVNPPETIVSFNMGNSDIATISSSGLITGVRAGFTILSVSAGGDPSYVIIYVMIEDGVYRFRNANATTYLTVDFAEEGYKVKQRNLINNGVTDDQRIRQMWKIKYLGSGKYSIRPVFALFMGLSSIQEGSFTYVSTHNIATIDYAYMIPNSQQWTISRPYVASDYVRLSQNGQSGKTVQALNGITNNGTAAVLDQESSSLYALWYPEKVNSVSTGVYLYDKETHHVITPYSDRYIAPEEELNNIIAVGYSGDVITQFFTWIVEDHVQVTGYFDPVFKGLTPGCDIIQVRWTYKPNNNPTTFFYMTVTEIANGTYFIKNKQSGKYADIYNQYMNDGTNVHQWEFHGGASQRWIFTRIENEYYSVVSANSGVTTYYLSQEHDTAFDDNIVIDSHSIDDGKKWKVKKATVGAYILVTDNGLDNYFPPSEMDMYVMSIASNNSDSNGCNIQQSLYTDNANYTDEWSLLSTDRVLETPLIGQSTDCWCWVASAQMLSRTNFPTEANNGNSSTIEQEQRLAVYHVFGNSSSNGNNYDWNSDPQNLNSKSGIYSDVANASAFLTGLANGSKVYSGYIAPYEEDILIEFISDGYAVARLYGWTTCNVSMPNSFEDIIDILLTFNPQLGGHVTVISGVCWSSSRNCFLFKVLDPWSGGSIDWLTYSQLLFNANNNGNQYDITFWFPTAVTNTYYSDNTFMGTLFSEDYSS